MGESTWHLLVHYVQDLFHYDGKTWHSFTTLIRKPGQVPKEYLEGKRLSNIDPVRFYIFSSTVFFILFFTVVAGDTTVELSSASEELRERLHYLEKEKEYLAGHPDTGKVNVLIQSVAEDLDSLQRVTGDTATSGFRFTMPEEAEQDSAGWLYKLLVKRSEERQKELDEKYAGNVNKAFRDLVDEFLHKLPQLIFLSLPFFALFLKILYLPRRIRYVDHLVFSVYQYAYFYSLMIFYTIAQWLVTKANLDFIIEIFDYLVLVFVVYLFVYLYLSMKRFYSGRGGLLLLRFIILIGATQVTLLLLAGVIAVITYLL